MVLDSGDIFGVDDRADRAACVLDCYTLLGCDALALGDQDLLRGQLTPSQLTERLPFLCANLEPTEVDHSAIPGTLILERSGARIGLTAVINEEIWDLDELLFETGYRVTPWREALDAALTELEAAGCTVTILLSHLGVADEVAAAGEFAERLDLIVGGHAGLFQHEAETGEGAPIVWPGRLGRYLGVARISLEPDDHGALLSYEALPIDNRWEREPVVVERLRRYETERYDHWLENYYTPTSEPLYHGPADCGACHTAELEQWRGTDHAHAFATLVENGDERNLECVRCHTTGFGRPGGFGDAELTPQLTEVGCQSCHETSREHPYDSADVPAVTPDDCLRCHKPDRDDDFDYTRDYELVFH